MKLRNPSDGLGGIESEGKILEIMPFITDGFGTPLALPPVRWVVPNWMLGFHETHTMSYPFTYLTNERVTMPAGHTASQVQFMVRLLENQPDSEPSQGSVISADAVNALLAGIEAINVRRAQKEGSE